MIGQKKGYLNCVKLVCVPMASEMLFFIFPQQF